ncbi:alpha/beta fold hydrolase [Microvirga makkahensis]|uniref:Alpha/beta fold hydrolase n=1 Tax=Microvirga makkahensis TaxID=1128670 RepID=A0A7X3MXA7_9HYPH|nr:alpha/beta hydrolase [Microvirga makkahensis]MXQ14904.1 alpha/beta fold hydrolase [Microvirga makkahensis]
MKSLERDGVKLFYQESEGADRPILLVHGWCCDHTYLAFQHEYFARAGHRVVSVDLRGHGQSDKPHQSYTMQVFADDLAWLCQQLSLSGVVVVGHSMGGIVAFDLACRRPDTVSAAVMLDAAVVLPSAARAAIPHFLEELRSINYRDALRSFVTDALFLATDDSERKQRILKAMLSTPQHVVVSAFEGLRDYDPSAAAKGLAAPCLYIAADEVQPRSDAVKFHEIAPGVAYGKTVGSGHFCQMEVPDQVNAMIERFLFVISPI